MRKALAFGFYNILVPALGIFLSQANAAVVVFDNIPEDGQTGYDSSYYSHGFEAQSTAELGNVVNLDGTARTLETITITMVTRAKSTDWAALYAANNSGWYHDLMVTVWTADASVILGSKTLNTLIPWATPAPGYSGMAFNVAFDFSSEGITLPNSVLVSLAYNTQNRGYSPLGTAGPYNSLNYGVFDFDPFIGTDATSSEVMRVYSSNPDVIVFESAPGWTDRTPMMQITATSVSDYVAGFNLTGPDADPNADPDGDGFSNRVEFAFGMNPASATSGQTQPLEVSTQTATTGGAEATTVNGTFYQRPGVTYVVRASSDLSNGLTDIVTPTPSADQTGVPPGYVKYEAVYNSGSDRAFMRIDATVP